jgi:hypothetical protein
MKRTYLALAGLALAASAAPAALAPLARGAALFDSQPVEPSRFSVLARPVGEDRWNLVVLEQIAAEPLCWEKRADGLIDPALNRFDFSGICGRYLDSNGYSLRIGEEDLAARYRLKLQQQGEELQLQATDADASTVLVVARAPVPLRDKDGFVSLQLEPGWSLQRRVYQEKTLNHLYFANGTPLGQLLADAGARQEADTAVSAARPLRRVTSPFARREEAEPQSIAAAPATAPQHGRAIALQVIPYQEISRTP